MIIDFHDTQIDLSDFDGIEIEAVHEGTDFCEVVHDLNDGTEIHFWTVYGHLRNGHVTALIDCTRETDARVAGQILENLLHVTGNLNPQYALWSH